MKTIVAINGLNYASTGKIMNNVATAARKEGYRVYTCCRNSIQGKKYSFKNQIYIGTWLDRVISERLSYIVGLNGYFNIINTYIFINKLKKIKPDLIHFHALCDNYINIKMLFNYIHKNNIPVVWTFHDPWAMTGRCAQSVCNKWETGCGNCPYLKIYPPTLFLDNSRYVWNKRKSIYNSTKNMVIVTPSIWLAEQVKKSLFDSKYKVQTINNGIDFDIYKPTSSDFRKKLNIENKFIILGVSYGWSKEKGLDTFIELANKLNYDNYQIVLVGGNDETDKLLPDNIISIHKTQNQKELVEIYSSSDLFVNPTIDDNFPTVNIEALACGIPVLTYETGGSAEIIDNTCGDSVKTGDRNDLLQKIVFIHDNKPYKKDDCLNRAKEFDMYKKFKEYVDLYKEMLGD